MTNGNGYQQPVFDGKTEVPVTLQVNTWNVILSLISKAPWEVADPLIRELQRQIALTLDPPKPDHDPARPLA